MRLALSGAALLLLAIQSQADVAIQSQAPQAVYPDGGSVPASQPPPPTGAIGRVQTFTVWLDDQTLNVFLDAGLPVTPGTHYQRWTGRSWQLAADAGFAAYPNWGPAVFVEQTTQATCASATLCIGYDGGIDRAQAAAYTCGCSTGASCSLSDGGSAPRGNTLQPGTFVGAGCQPKACVANFTSVAYAGEGVPGDTTWPSVCPLQ